MSMTSSIKSEVRSLNPSPYNDNHIRNQQEGAATADKINILGVGGSMRQGSYSTLTLKLVLEEAKKYQSETCMLELGKITLPLYNPSEASSDYTSYNNNNNYHLEKITKTLKWADAFILASPDYHGSMSGALKNFLDYFWEEFAGKTFGYIVASHEKGLTVVDQINILGVGGSMRQHSCSSMLWMEYALQYICKWRKRLRFKWKFGQFCVSKKNKDACT